MTKIIIKKREVLLGVVDASEINLRDVTQIDSLIKNKLLNKINISTPTFNTIQELFLHYWNAYGLEVFLLDLDGDSDLVDDNSYGLARLPLDNNGIQKGILKAYTIGGVAELGKVVLDYMYIPSEDFLSSISDTTLDLPLRTAEVENLSQYLKTRGVNLEILKYNE
nr:MAG TPA: hypothetical protein [Bacteriophage sp.]DAS09605.1 MAG TPA: hypothetical protein [Bacteriophage sp.]